MRGRTLLTVAVAFAAAATVLAEEKEKHQLAWKLSKGRKLAVSWKIALKTARPATTEEFVVELGGVLAVTDVKDGVAVCALTLDRLSNKGTQGGKEIDLLLEKGAVVRGGERAERLLPELAKVAKVSVGPRGEYAVLDAGETRLVGALLGDKSAIVGPGLPEKPVAVGDTWPGTLERGITFDVSYKLASLEKGVAKIALDESKETTQKGAKVKIRYVLAADFDVALGHCSRSKMTATGRVEAEEDSDDRADFVAAMEFEATPAKEE